MKGSGRGRDGVQGVGEEGSGGKGVGEERSGSEREWERKGWCAGSGRGRECDRK